MAGKETVRLAGALAREKGWCRHPHLATGITETQAPWQGVVAGPYLSHDDRVGVVRDILVQSPLKGVLLRMPAGHRNVWEGVGAGRCGPGGPGSFGPQPGDGTSFANTPTAEQAHTGKNSRTPVLTTGLR